MTDIPSGMPAQRNVGKNTETLHKIISRAYGEIEMTPERMLRYGSGLGLWKDKTPLRFIGF